MSDKYWIILAVGVGVVFLVIGVLIGYLLRKKSGEKKIGSAEEKAKNIINDAIKTAETKSKELLVEAKDDAHKIRTEAEKEAKNRQNELSQTEKRLMQREDMLDRREQSYEDKFNNLDVQMKKAEALQVERAALIEEERRNLEQIAGMTADQAKEFLLESLRNDVKHESAAMIREAEARVKEEADDIARELVSRAIQRVASDRVAESTVSVVALPNDEMKGRIIGREGRNIRAIEQMTGVDLIIDDTPESITISCFDGVRREIARIALERLIQDGRIHPTRVNDTVEKARKEVDATIKKEGESAVFDVNLHGINPELVKILGRLRYRTSFGQNVLIHSIEVARISGVLAGELGVDVTAAKRAGLLHDIGKAMDQEMEGSHVSIGVELARKYREHENIIHAIEAHHGDVECKTILAAIVQAADAISAARPGARREDVENYIRRLEKLESIANEFGGVENSYAIQAGREIRVMVRPEEIGDDDMVLLARNIANRIENELEYPGQIKVHVIRENRAVEYAK